MLEVGMVLRFKESNEYLYLIEVDYKEESNVTTVTGYKAIVKRYFFNNAEPIETDCLLVLDHHKYTFYIHGKELPEKDFSLVQTGYKKGEMYLLPMYTFDAQDYANTKIKYFKAKPMPNGFTPEWIGTHYVICETPNRCRRVFPIARKYKEGNIIERYEDVANAECITFETYQRLVEMFGNKRR